jgi:hypothetical protein
MTNDKIIEMAKLMIAVDQSEDPALVQLLESSFKQFSGIEDGMLLQLAYKLLCDKPYVISSDNEESVRRCFELADDLGATTKDVSGSDAPWWAACRSGQQHIFRFEPDNEKMAKELSFEIYDAVRGYFKDNQGKIDVPAVGDAFCMILEHLCVEHMSTQAQFELAQKLADRLMLYAETRAEEEREAAVV